MKKNSNNGRRLAFWLFAFTSLAFACREKSPAQNGHEGMEMPEQKGHEGMEMPAQESHADMKMDGLDSIEILLKPTNEYVLSNVKTIRPERKTQPTTLEAPGYLTYDARAVNVVSARFGGRIERLYVRSLFQSVKKGQRLLDIYSPEISAAQADLIFLKENDSENTSLLENARRRLALLGLSAGQISEAETSRKPILSLPVFSQYAGLLIENTGANQPETAPGSGMNDKMVSSKPAPSAAAPNAAAEFSLKEGMYVQPGQRLFGLQSITTVWAVLEFYPAQIRNLKIGQSVELKIESLDKPFFGKINFIEPLYGSENKNLRARVYLPNPDGRLKPGTLLTATVQPGSRSALWIPATAALDLGNSAVVFVKTGGGFRSRKISIGSRFGQMVEVLSGISPEDEIAENGQLLMDSEAFITAN